MRVTMLLADAAQAVDNKLYILGGGWSVTGPGPTNFAIALKIEVPWDQTNRRHQWRMELIDADGRQVLLAGPSGAQPLAVGGDFEVGRPAGTPDGTPIDLALAVNLGAVPFPAGLRLVWKLWIDDETSTEWRRPSPPALRRPLERSARRTDGVAAQPVGGSTSTLCRVTDRRAG